MTSVSTDPILQAKSSRPASVLSDPAPACLTIFLFISALLLVLILRRNAGHFSYTLDDPYIHLALAERIARGFYGLNVGELTTPSSSILWPFMLVPGAGSSWHPYLPLIYNLIFGSAAAWLMGLMARRWQWLQSGSLLPLRVWAISFLLVLGANLPGLTFTGMEHVLQVLTAVVCAYGIMCAYDGQSIPLWCIATIVVAPAIRYESYILCVALAVALLVQRRPAAAAAVLSLSLLAPVFFALYLVTHGHPPLPNSILVKGAAFASHHGVLINLLLRIEKNLIDYAIDAKRLTFLVVFPVLTYAIWKLKRDRPHRNLLLGVFLALALQIVAGSYGWFHRYEVFAKVLSVLVLLVASARIRKPAVFWPIAALLAFATSPYISGTAKTTTASADIYEQQFQMRRLAQAYGGNFAVNDLGWVSYQLKPSVYVLDLAGLASLEAMRQVEKTPEWLDDVTRRHACGLVMVYPQWFTQIPADWTPVGKLSFGIAPVSVFIPEVYFYETPFGTAEERKRLADLLQNFKADLPPDDTFVLNPPRPVRTSSWSNFHTP